MNLVTPIGAAAAGRRSPVGPGTTAQLAGFTASLHYAAIDEAARQAARHHLIDTLTP